MNSTPMNNAGPTSILLAAAKTIDARANDRDTPAERSMEGTVKAFNAIYGTNLTESQGWAFMVLLKMKRQSTGPAREDDFVDGAAYVALLGESRKKDDEPKAASSSYVAASRTGARLPTIPTAPPPSTPYPSND